MKSFTYKITTAIIIIILLPLNSRSQHRIKTEANADIIEYSEKEGLPTTNISKIVQTKDGYIWLSSVEGTFRFDGYEFDEVGAEIGLPKMQNLYYDSANNILYFASPKKFISFDGNDFTIYSEKEGYKINGLAGQVIVLLQADSKGRIWIGSTSPFVDKKFNGGLTMFSEGEFTVYDSVSYPLHNATSFIETPYGDLIFGSNGKNTQTAEESYIALFKEDKFKRIDETEGIYLQNVSLLGQFLLTSIDKSGNTWLAFTGVNSFTGRNTVNNRSTAGVLMYDGNKFHQYPEVLELIKPGLFPVAASYSKTLDKVILTTLSPTPLRFEKENINILEFDNGTWSHSSAYDEIKTIKNLKTNEVIDDYNFSGSFYIKANKYFPELLVFASTSRNQTQSSKYPYQLFSYKDDKWTKFDAFNGYFFGETKDGLLLDTPKGFAIYYPDQSKMLTEKDGLLKISSGIPNFYQDRKGIVWISFSYTALPAYANLESAGVNIWDGKSLRSYTEADGLKSDITFNTYQDLQNRVWIPTAKGVVRAREIRNSEGDWLFKFYNVDNSKRNNYNVTNIFETSGGDIYAWQNYIRPAYGKMTKADFYFGKFDGVKFNEIPSPFTDELKQKKYQLISLKENIDGKLWLEGIFADNIKDLTSAETTIMLYDGNEWSPPPASWNIPKEQIHYVGTLKNGMYFLTVGGFYNFNGERFINLSDSVDANADFRILKGASVAGTHTNIQSDERLYIRLRNRGLVIFDGTNLNFYTKKNGLPSANISNPITDHNENVIFGFPSGALVVNGENFQSYYDDENIVTGGAYSACLDINNDMVMFYNGVGLYIYKQESRSFPLKISSVIIDATSHFNKFPEELEYWQNTFVFNYAALNYKEPDQTKYEHILEGYDDSWSRPSEMAFSEYQNLPSGKFNFKVRAITSNGIKTNEASYSFIITPPIWETWWAYLIYILFGIGFLYVVRKFELKRQTKNARIKEIQLRAETAELQAKAAETQAKLVQVENERKTKELEEARNLQLSMLPKELPQLPNLDIAVYMKTATEVGGDYYDYHIHMDGTFTIVLGDATGHGMQAGMMVSIMKSLFMSDRANKELIPFYHNTNAAIKDMHLGRLMMALTSVQFVGNKIRSANAGMPPLLFYKYKQNSLEEFTANNMPLGAIREIEYSILESEIEHGDTLLLMTDGFPELTNPNKEMIGYDVTKKLFLESARNPAEEIIKSFKQYADEWTNGEELIDDVTFVVIKVK